ncbi:hypothetical protein GE09DRAFT_643769 [Coniochaeta sp. 2T2.1]|nr:hypothetical protein GE09DRAFT_643769 [Coniochaeta sp. 2T2.1]
MLLRPVFSLTTVRLSTAVPPSPIAHPVPSQHPENPIVTRLSISPNPRSANPDVDIPIGPLSPRSLHRPCPWTLNYRIGKYSSPLSASLRIIESHGHVIFSHLRRFTSQTRVE